MKKKALLKMNSRSKMFYSSQAILVAGLGIAALIYGFPLLWLIFAVGLIGWILMFLDGLHQETGWPKYNGWPHIEVDQDTGRKFEVNAKGEKIPLDEDETHQGGTP